MALEIRTAVHNVEITCPPENWGLLFSDLANLSNLYEVQYLRIPNPTIPTEVRFQKKLQKISWKYCDTVGDFAGLSLAERVTHIEVVGKTKELEKLMTAIAGSSGISWVGLLETGLTEVPESILLPQVTRLDLTGNQLAELPDDFDRLENLEYLHLADNAFATMPQVLKQMENLKWVDFTGNPISFSEEDEKWRATLGR